jgi:phenylpyruvate tautomerase PptA (4-oxalocrotonate tautomerase family)
MPMLDVTIPEGALQPAAERALLHTLTSLLLTCEGVDPLDPVARKLAWAYLFRPEAIVVGGEEITEPRYRVIATVPAGLLDAERRSRLVADVTEAVLDAEDGRYRRNPNRVWVFPTEVPEGAWGAAGRIFRLKDILAVVKASPDAAQG